MKIPIVLVLSINLLLVNFSTLEPETPELDVSTYRMVWTDSDGNEVRETENNMVSPTAIFTWKCGTDKITQIGCLAHGRRKFVEGLKVVKEKTENATMCSDILKTINKIFSEDRKTENLNLEEKQEMRLKSLTPLFDKFKNELETASTTILPKSVLGKAITYNLNQFESFKRVLLDPRLELTNNRAERAIKPFVIVSKKLAIQ